MTIRALRLGACVDEQDVVEPMTLRRLEAIWPNGGPAWRDLAGGQPEEWGYLN
jgi:hypothetical protein